MTEATLKKAVEIKKELDTARERHKFLESIVDEAYKADMRGMKFSIVVSSDDFTYKKSECISPETAETALCSEIKDVMKNIESLERKLAEMH